MDSESSNSYQAVHEVGPARKPALLLSFRFWIPTVVSVLALLTIPVAFIVGAVIAESQQYDRRAEHQKQRIEAFFAEYPDKFGNLTIEKASDGWAYPLGTVKTQADYDILVRRLHEMFGDESAEQMIHAVHIE